MNIDKISAAMCNLLRDDDRVFYAALLLQMRIEYDKSIGTMGVSLKDNVIRLIVNPEFIEKLKLSELSAILEHEALHVILQHFNRRLDKDTARWNVACDLAVNQMINGLPDTALLPKDYDFPEELPAEQYYDRIPKEQSKETIDNHSQWRPLTDTEKEIIRQAVEEANKRTQGKVPGAIKSYLDELLKGPTIPWQHVLRQYIHGSIRAFKKFSWKRPNRRFGFSQPGKVSQRVARIIIAIDTSGSVSDEELKMFLAEIYEIQKIYPIEIKIIQADAKVQKVDTLRKGQTFNGEIEGRGGTNFIPVFKYIKEKHLNVDLLLYLTDGFGDFPNKQPSYNVLWVLTEDGIEQNEIPFGRTLRLKKEEVN